MAMRNLAVPAANNNSGIGPSRPCDSPGRRYRPGSITGDGERVSLHQWERARWLFHVGALFPPDHIAARIARVLADALGAVTGRLDPTLAWIAKQAGVCERHITRGLRMLKAAGLLTSQLRRIGLRQTSSAYQLRLPEAAEAGCEDGETLQPVGESDECTNGTLEVGKKGLPDIGEFDKRQAAEPGRFRAVAAVIRAAPAAAIDAAKSALAAAVRRAEARLMPSARPMPPGPPAPWQERLAAAHARGGPTRNAAGFLIRRPTG
jgi:hypothetical protein